MAKFKCPECGAEIEVDTQFIKTEYARIGGRSTSPTKKISSAENGKKGGRPRSDNPVRKRPYHKKEE